MRGNIFLVVTESQTRDGGLTPHKKKVMKKLVELMYEKISNNSSGLEKKAYIITTTENHSEEGADIISNYFKNKEIDFKKEGYVKLWVEERINKIDPLVEFVYEKMKLHGNYSLKMVCAGRNLLFPVGLFIKEKENFNIKKIIIKENYALNFDCESGLYLPLKVELED